MRIGDHGSSGFSGSSGGRGGGDRARIFRNRHRVGERIRGRLLRWEQPGLAWVDIQGQELLARIHSQPEPGRMLAFLVVQLYPDIVLQELHGGGHGPGTAVTLAQAVHAFWAARSLYESAARGLRRDTALGRRPTPERRRALHADLCRSPEALSRYLRLLEALDLANAFLIPAGAGRLCYPAWLLPPEALAAEMLVRHCGDDRLEASLSFALPRAGQCLARVMVRAGDGSGRPQGRCRVTMERPGLGQAMDAALDVTMSSLPAKAGATGLERAETGPLEPAHRTGLLAGLLRSGDTGRPMFATRV